MPTLIKHQCIETPNTDDPLPLPTTLTQLLEGNLSDYTTVQLAPDEDCAALVPWLPQIRLLILQLPTFQDGRAFSQAVELRQRHHYTHELRAIGDILPDITYHLHHCGFDSFLIPDAYSAQDALTCLHAFTTPYQATQRTGQPWFRRSKI